LDKCHVWLHREIVGWLRDGLVGPDQAQALHARYPVGEPAQLGRTALSVLGAVIFGLGVILLIAYNWQAMHRYAKLALVLGALGSAHLGGLLLRDSRRRAAAEGMHALGSVLFGSAIWLVAQTYHIEGHYPTAFLIWGLGTLLMAWVLPSASQGLMAVVLVVTWQATEIFDFHQSLTGLHWLLLLGVFPLAWQLRAPVLSGATTLALLGSLAIDTAQLDGDLAFSVLVLTAGAAGATGRLLPRLGDAGLMRIAPAIALPGQATYLALLYLLTFPEITRSLFQLQLARPAVAGYFYSALALAVGLWTAALVPWRRAEGKYQSSDFSMLAGLGLVAAFSLVDPRGDGWLTAAPFNLLLLVHGILLVATGARTGATTKLLAGALLIALLAAGRYLDLFESLIVRALVFFGVGVALLAMGNWHSRRRRAAGEALP
jgi:uncharacterized membrane protein